MKILNFGSLNIDYVYDVPHFVTAGETINSFGRNIFPGGKGANQSIALAKAGAEVYHAGSIGFDGDILLSSLLSGGVHTDYIKKLADIPSGHTIIQVDPNGQNCIIVYGGSNREISEHQIDRTLSFFETGDFLVLQNEINNISYLMTLASQKGIRIVLNPSPIDDSIFSLPLDLVDFLVVNEIEGALIAGVKENSEILPALAVKYPRAKVLLTLGSDGAQYFDGNQTFSQPIFPVKAVDTTAAGDTFLGYFIAATAKGIDPQQALRRAARASSIAVSQKGAASSIPALHDVLAAEETTK